MIAGIMWDWVWTGVAVYVCIGALGLFVFLSLVLLYGAALGVARLIDWWQRRRWGAFNPAQDLIDKWAREAKENKTDKPMQAQKMDHIKYDILPDGTLSPGDPRGLENPE